MQVYDASTDVIVRQKNYCSRKLDTILRDIKVSGYTIGTIKISSLVYEDEVLFFNSYTQSYFWRKLGKSVTVNTDIRDNFYQFTGAYGVGGSGFHEKLEASKVVSAKSMVVCKVDDEVQVVSAEQLYKLAWTHKVAFLGYNRDIEHGTDKLGVVELPLAIEKCSKTVAISSVEIDRIPDNLFMLTRQDNDYIF